MLTEAGAAVVLCSAELASDLAAGPAKVVTVDEDPGRWPGDGPGRDEVSAADPDSAETLK